MIESDLIKKKVFDTIASLIDGQVIEINASTPLIGEQGILDSIKLVELSVRLEDLALELGFEFDWTSSSAMSRTRSMFRTGGSIFEEFVRQMALTK